ncbi:MAG: PD-(D/E)XK nuclease family protein [Actinomycetota bacterium]|nr:PD-(D/E)XK nuclease family protein [Actinomycetota bacterium]
MRSVNNVWKLSPSDLCFLYEECPRCFWLKVASKLPRPRGPFPGVFSLLDSQMKRHFLGTRTEQISSAIKPGVVRRGDRWVRSRPLVVPGHSTTVVLQGRYDTAFEFDDGTFGLADYKMTDPRSDRLVRYSRQLHAYALAAEIPAPGAPTLHPVTQLGLVCVQPTEMVALGGDVAYRGTPRWVEIPRDDRSFVSLLSRVLDVLESAAPPEPSADCTFCDYIGRRALHLGDRDGSGQAGPTPVGGRLLHDA